MPKQFQAITSEFARQQMLGCYERGGAGNVIESTLDRLADPIQRISEKGRRRFHPLLWTGFLLAVCVAGIFLYFTVKH